MPQRSMIDWPGCSRLRRVWHLRSGLRPSLRRHTRINHHPILSLTLVLKSGGPHGLLRELGTRRDPHLTRMIGIDELDVIAGLAVNSGTSRRFEYRFCELIDISRPERRAMKRTT